MTRQDLVAVLADRIAHVKRSHPVRVAIDGVDAAGKTTLAAEHVAPHERAGRVRQRYAERYVPGQRLYLTEAQPEQHASVVVDNNDAAHPRLGGL